MSKIKPTNSASSPPDMLAKNSIRPRVIPVAGRTGTLIRFWATSGDKDPPDSNRYYARAALRQAYLLGREILVIAQVHHILERRRSRGQVSRIQEQRVERIVTGRRAVHHRAAFECSSVVLGVVHAHQRSVVEQLLAAPVFQITEEVMQPSIRSKVFACTPAGLRKRNILAGCDGGAIVRGKRRSAS